MLETDEGVSIECRKVIIVVVGVHGGSVSVLLLAVRVIPGGRRVLSEKLKTPPGQPSTTEQFVPG